ncbi:carbohydrate ABC transporter permease [Amycolatopsis alkalitolerans]|uniref:Sugar ABC transporter permease n=1 Tax=Amycolatopsis alkalitolerans TaxID=2547244 RepID=A0A5C4M7M3_9PSEU|nr:sugar ABC transporter permease [Amycolatopsis alkalitolerans]TNC29447.1 sugar ABC transporter permease [Amycolatopsis alkalitolerans]
MTAVAPMGDRVRAAMSPPAAGRPRKRRWSRFGLVAVAPFALFLVVFGIYPMVQLVTMSISNVTILHGGFRYQPAGLGNFARIFTDPDTAPVVGVTIVFIACAVVLTVVLGTFLAVMLDRAPFMRRVARRMLIWPTVIAPVVVSVIWMLLLSPAIGLVNKVLAALGLPQQGWLGEPAGALIAIIVVDVWHWAPLVFLLVYTALQSLDPEVLEAARVDGAGEGRVIRQVVLPMIRPAIVTAAVIRLVMCVKAFDEMYLLTHGGPGNATNLISLDIRTIFFDRLEFGYGAAIGVAIIIVFVLLGGIFAAVRRFATGREAAHA